MTLNPYINTEDRASQTSKFIQNSEAIKGVFTAQLSRASAGSLSEEEAPGIDPALTHPR